MFTFITSFIVTIIISLCFFKKRFWENRFLVLLIGAGVALIATLTINYSVRGNLETQVVDIKKRPLHTFALPDSIFPDSTYSTRFIKDWDFFNDHSSSDFAKKKGDSTQVFATFLLYTDDDDDDKQTIYIGSFIDGNQTHSNLLKRYIVPSSADTIGYLLKEKIIYKIPDNNRWLSNFGFPRIGTIKTYHVPPKEYAMLPDSLIRKRPIL